MPRCGSRSRRWAGTGTAIPEEFGGLGLGYLELCVIAEEMGRALAPVPFSSTVYLFAEALLVAGTDEQKKRLLPKVASGEIVGTFARAEGPGAVLRRTSRTTLKGGKLSGRKIAVVDGPIADYAVVLAQTSEGSGERGLQLALVDLRGRGRQAHDLRDAGLQPRPFRHRVRQRGPPSRSAKPGEGWSDMQRVLDRAAILLAFEQVGGADVCLALAKDYALNRYAFGRPIASFQAIKHKLADMYVYNELARSNAYYGAWALSPAPASCLWRQPPRASRATQAFDYAAKENIQDPWRHRLHLGDGLPLLLQAREGDRPGARPPARLEGTSSSPSSKPRTLKSAPLSCPRRRASRASGTGSPPSRGRRRRERTDAQQNWETKMDFEDSPEEAAFRKEVRHLARRQCQEAQRQARILGRGHGERRRRRDGRVESLAEDKAKAGYARITWPKGMGGIGGTPMQSIIFGQEESKYDVATGAPFAIGLGMCIPTLMAYGDDAAKKRFVWPACRATRSGASSSPSRPAAPTSPTCAPRRRRTPTAPGRSTARRSGPPARNSPTTE